MKKTLLILSMLLGLMAWQACEYNWVETTPPPLPETVSFATNIQPIFNSDCVSCHDAGGTSPDLTEGNAYNDLFTNNLVDTLNPESSVLYTKMAKGGSMYSFTKTGQADLVLKWIQQGAQNN